MSPGVPYRLIRCCMVQGVLFKEVLTGLVHIPGPIALGPSLLLVLPCQHRKTHYSRTMLSPYTFGSVSAGGWRLGAWDIG